MIIIFDKVFNNNNSDNNDINNNINNNNFLDAIIIYLTLKTCT